MITAIIAALTSLVISFLSLYQALKNQRLQKEQFEKTQKRNLTTKLYDLRLTNYPKAFEITDKIQKVKGGNFNVQHIENICKELTEWKSGIVSLIISIEALKAYYDLKDALERKPSLGEKFANEQVDKIWKLRNDFRRRLRRDVGFLYKEESNKVGD
jgi:hypothetical protein